MTTAERAFAACGKCGDAHDREIEAFRRAVAEVRDTAKRSTDSSYLRGVLVGALLTAAAIGAVLLGWGV